MSEPRPLLLIVEDDPSLARILEDFLTQEGWGVLTASSGWEAKRLLDEAPPELFSGLLTDLRMPGFDGIALLREIFSRPRGLRRVVILSMWWREEETRFRAMLNDAAHSRAPNQLAPHWTILEKPFGPAELRAALRGDLSP